MKKKQSGYFWRFRKTLLRLGVFKPIWIRDFSTPNDSKKIYKFVRENLNNLNNKQISYLVRNNLYLKSFFFTLLLITNLFAFQGAGDCEKIISDYAQLTNRSVFLPHALQGQCIVQSEKHFPLILKNAGYNFTEKSGTIQIKEIPIPKEKEKEPFKPKDLFYDVTFVFINTASALDCGLSVDDILMRWNNLQYSFTFGGAFGCPAFDYDGSFGFAVNAHLKERWEYSHGVESQRQYAQITSSTGAITNQYEWITTGLVLVLTQNENGIYYDLKYTSQNGSVTHSYGGIVEELRSLVEDEYTRTRKLWLLPLGRESVKSRYSLLLRITPKL